MSRGMPSMVALLGLLAVAGYQNRDKLAEMLGSAQGRAGDAPGQKNLPGGLGGLLGGSTVGSVLSGGIGELVDRFRQAGQADTADSWVGKGPNQPVSSSQLEQAIGPEALASLEQHTGLSRQELISRLTRTLPEAVDKYTPEGRLPGPEQATA
jgi:uncharacterized protein YidB (DUF937 family)